MLGDVTQALTSAISGDCFCHSVKVPARSLSISVEGVGPISFPVSPCTAKALIKESNLAPFGWRDQTVVDTRVRNAWEVDRSLIRIPKTDLLEVLSPVAEQMKSHLGFSPKGVFKAELHNMVVYEKDQFFACHQDSEKEDGMVATMVILLPSRFSGGSLVIDHHGEKRTFRAPSKTTNELQIITFYADCHHQVQRVTSGHRIALTFNLSYSGPAPDDIQSCHSKILKTVAAYFASEQVTNRPYRIPAPRWLVYLLDHQYSQRGLSWSQLKGKDRVRAAELLAVARELNLCPHLALTEIHEVWDAAPSFDDHWGSYRRNRWSDDSEGQNVDDGDIEVGSLIDGEHTLDHWVDERGKKASLGSHDVSQNMLCWSVPNESLDPFETEYQGYMGNYGNTVDRWYHRAALVLWPKDRDLESRFAIDPIATLLKIKKTLLRDPKEGARLLERVLPQWGRLQGNKELELGDVLEIATLVADRDRAAALLSGLNLEILCKRNTKGLRKLVERYGEGWACEQFEAWSERRAYNQERISDLIHLVKNLSEYPKPVRWILTRQFRTLTEDNRGKSQTRAELEQSEDERLAHALEFLQALSVAGTPDIAKRFIRHILSDRRAYSASALAKLSIRLNKSSVKDPAWEAFPAEASTRLQAMLSKRRREGDVSIPEESRCDCADCKDLSKFLRDSKSDRLVWPLAKERRRHIHSIIDRMGIGVTHRTERAGSPHRLVLTKTSAYFKKEKAARSASEKLLRKLGSLG